jgi:hypothetical protein
LGLTSLPKDEFSVRAGVAKGASVRAGDSVEMDMGGLQAARNKADIRMTLVKDGYCLMGYLIINMNLSFPWQCYGMPQLSLDSQGLSQ